MARPHHPLRGVVVPVVEYWEHRGERFCVIELPDESHVRVPLSWVDDGKTPLSAVDGGGLYLSGESARDFARLITSLRGHPSRATTDVSSPDHRSEEDGRGHSNPSL